VAAVAVAFTAAVAAVAVAFTAAVVADIAAAVDTAEDSGPSRSQT
jgi:hypothetical protein